MLSGKLLPVHFKPNEDELLSSWVIRLARGNGSNLHSFCRMLWPKKAIWTRDIDKSADRNVVEVLSRKTGTSSSTVEETLLKSYEGIIYEKHNANGVTSFINNIGVYHRTRRLFGQCYCVDCLKENIYFRKSWRLSFITVCTKHQVLLRDSCYYCKAPLAFHKLPVFDKNILICSVCNKNLLSAKTIRANESVIELTKDIEQCLMAGWMLIGQKQVYSLAFFSGLRHFFRIFLNNKGIEPFVKLVSDGTNVESTIIDVERSKLTPECGHIQVRYMVMSLIAEIFKDWPNKFVYYFNKSQAYPANFKRDAYLPYWLEIVYQLWISRKYRAVSKDEVQAIIDYLREHKKDCTVHEIHQLSGHDISHYPQLLKLLLK
ncbi:MAG: hypothetical protein CMP47_02875 [Rickettsiales bacterium]|nr:hypothetical protein [Rickettsiales bacterium]